VKTGKGKLNNMIALQQGYELPERKSYLRFLLTTFAERISG